MSSPEKNSYRAGNRYHKCNFCAKSFSEKGKLKMHIHLIHEDYKCEYCDKSFYRTTTMMKHIDIVHEGQKDYKCEICDKSFAKGGACQYM